MNKEDILKSGFDEATDLLLQDILKARQLDDVKDLVARIMKLEFHDYWSPHKAPKAVLVDALVRAGLDGIAENVPCGRYNQTQEEFMKCVKEQLKDGFKKNGFGV